MNNIIKSIALAGAFIVTIPQVQATLITNGDFDDGASCNLSSWDQYGLVDTSGTTGNCAAELEVNDFQDYEAELWQQLSIEENTDYVLSVNFDVETTFDDTIFDDWFSISLLNSDFDILELFSFNITGIDTFSTSLAINADDLTSFVNQDWLLSFYLYDDISFDDNSSFVAINNLSLTKVPTDVPEPSSLAIFALGFAGLMVRRKQANELVRRSIKK